MKDSGLKIFGEYLVRGIGKNWAKGFFGSTQFLPQKARNNRTANINWDFLHEKKQRSTMTQSHTEFVNIYSCEWASIWCLQKVPRSGDSEGLNSTSKNGPSVGHSSLIKSNTPGKRTAGLCWWCNKAFQLHCVTLSSPMTFKVKFLERSCAPASGQVCQNWCRWAAFGTAPAYVRFHHHILVYLTSLIPPDLYSNRGTRHG